MLDVTARCLIKNKGLAVLIEECKFVIGEIATGPSVS